MTSERRPGGATEGQVPYGGGLNQPFQRPPEAAHAPPEGLITPLVADVVIVDVAQLEAEQREQRPDRREYLRRYYHATKQAALAGDEEAQERWERRQHQNRDASRRWRQNHPEKHRAQVREYKRRKKLRAKDVLDSQADGPHGLE